MQENNPRESHAPRTSDYAGPASAANPRRMSQARPGGPNVRPQPRTYGAGAQHRPSGFAAPEAPRRPAPQAPAAAHSAAEKEEPKEPPRLLRWWKKRSERPKEINNKRSQAKRPNWLKRILIALAILLALFVLFVLIFGNNGETYHQLPRIERGGDSAYEPDASALPEGEAPADGEAQYLVAPDAGAQSDAGGSGGETDWSQYLVTPQPGVDLGAAAAAAGASYDASEGAGT